MKKDYFVRMKFQATTDSSADEEIVGSLETIVKEKNEAESVFMFAKTRISKIIPHSSAIKIIQIEIKPMN